MKLKYESREARRHRHNSPIWFRDIHTRQVRCVRPYMWVTTFAGYIWSYEYKRWVALGEPIGNAGGCSDFDRPCCYRKFKRLLRTWSKYLPPGVEFVLCGRLAGVSITGKTGVPK